MTRIRDVPAAAGAVMTSSPARMLLDPWAGAEDNRVLARKRQRSDATFADVSIR